MSKSKKVVPVSETPSLIATTIQEVFANPDVHSAAHLFPEMKPEEFEDLKKDLGNNGQRLPILLCDGKVIDGRHRLRACQALGITPKFEHVRPAANDSIESMVISINLQRRHLTESQRALIAAEMSGTGVGSNQHTAGAVTQKLAARHLGVSIDSLQRGKSVLSHGIPELVEAVSSGKLDITNAARLAKLAKEDQSKINFTDMRMIQEVSKAFNKAKFSEKRTEIAKAIEAKRANNKPLESGASPYEVIYADPPWNYMGEMNVGYPCMTTQEICDLPVPSITAEDGVLFMWASASLLPDALKVIEAWGYTFKTSAVWDKGIAGQGPYFRQAHEVLMLATKGQIPGVPMHARPSSVFNKKKGEHSAKPLEYLAMIDAMFPELNKLEMFCRGEPAAGWDGWGNECTQSPVMLDTQIAA